MAFVTIEDRTSSIELVCFSGILSKYGIFLNNDSVIAVRGTISVRDEEEPKLIARSVAALVSDTSATKQDKPNHVVPTENISHASSNAPKPHPITKLYLRFSSEDIPVFRRAKAVCSIFNGTIPVIYYFSDTGNYKPSGLYINPTEFVINELRELLGNENVVAR